MSGWCLAPYEDCPARGIDGCMDKEPCIHKGTNNPKPQPDPQPGTRAIVPLVMQDLEARRKKGIETYGRELEANNGRDALWDAYEEALDLACYLRQAIEERKR